MELICPMSRSCRRGGRLFFHNVMNLGLRIHISNKKINIRIFSLKCVKFSLTCK